MRRFRVTKQGRRLSLIVVVTVACLGLMAGPGCDSGEPEGNGGGGEIQPPAPGEVIYDVQYRDGVMEIATDAVVSADTAAHRYVLDADAVSDTGGPAVGDVVVIAGYDVGRVVAREETASGIAVTTERVPLTEAIENGQLAWNLSFEYTPESVGDMTVGGETGRWDAARGGFTFNYEDGDFNMTITITPEGDHADIETEVVKGEGENATARFTGVGRIEGFNSVVDAVYEDAELQSFSFDNTDLRGQMDLSMAAAGSGLGSLDFEMPEFAIEWPVPPSIIPIPTTIGVGVQFVASLTVINEASATLTTGLSFDGDAGFAFEDVDVEADVQFGDPNFDESTADAAATIGNMVDAQVGVAFPRVTLNVLNQEIAYVLTGMTAGSRLTWGPICKSGYTRLLVQGGYELSFFGVTLAAADTILFDRQQTGSQNDCADPLEGGDEWARPLDFLVSSR